MASVIRTSERLILEAIRDRLINTSVLDGQRILIVARNFVPYFGAPKSILIEAGEGQNAETQFDGMGRGATFVEQTIEITARSRMSLDQADRDHLWLTDASRGHSAFVHTIVDKLHKWQAWESGTGGNLLMATPMTFTGWGRPKRSPRDRRTFRGWGERVIRFGVRYLLDLDQSFQ